MQRWTVSAFNPVNPVQNVELRNTGWEADAR
jgi:hypothetical protein